MRSRYSAVPPPVMGRKQFVRLCGAGIAGVALVGMMGSGKTLARTEGSLRVEFEAAAREFKVPVELLLAMGYVNARWEMPPPESNEYEEGDLHGWGAYGIMQLVQNPWTNTLGEASRLTGLSEEELKTDRVANIRGGAALLAESRGKRPGSLGDWLGAVNGSGGGGKEYRAVAGVGAGELFAEQVSEVLEKGASKRTKNGEQVSLRARSLRAQVTAEGRVI